MQLAKWVEIATSWRVLTLKQPWASAVFVAMSTRHRRKNVENRTWLTTYRGPLVIHAGAGFDAGFRDWRVFEHDAARQRAMAARGVRSCVLGVVQLADIVTDDDGAWSASDHYHWRLERPRAVEPIADVCGRLGLWRPSETLAKAIARRLVA